MPRIRQKSELFVWAVLGLLTVAILAWAFPRAFPFFPDTWRLDRRAAIEVARDKLEVLGVDVGDALVAAGLGVEPYAEHRLHRAAAEGVSADRLRASAPAREIVTWGVRFYPRQGRRTGCAQCLSLTPAGEVVWLRLETPDEVEAELDAEIARRRADALLADLGYDPAHFTAPEVRHVERPGRTDLILRYGDPEPIFGAATPTGVEVIFAGDRLASFYTFLDDPARELFPGPWPEGLFWRLHIMAPFLLFPFLAVPFLRAYHEGEAGHRRALRIFLVLTAASSAATAFGALWTARWSLGSVPAWRAAGGVWLEGLLVWVLPSAALAGLGWAVGEARCRERWGTKLAGADAVLRGRFNHPEVAWAALRGPLAGALLVAAALVALPALPAVGARALVVWFFDEVGGASPWPGGSELGVSWLLAGALVLVQVAFLPPAVRRLGRIGGVVLVAAITGVLLIPPFAAFPPGAEILPGVFFAAALLGLFLAYDLLTVFFAAVTVYLLPASLPWLATGHPGLVVQAAASLAFLFLPLAVAWRGFAGEAAVYRFRDVPPHARRIVERERRRMELETASAVQRSILPSLSRRIDDVELAYAFRPAHEIGGDFFDVTPLPDGRLALAVGDVAGHGVASGLVMAMVRSSLAVQVAADPRIEAVFRSVNRTLFKTAKKSLLATLCYGVLDARHGELIYASAGHLCPFVIRADGGVQALEAPAYPLGVRSSLEIWPRQVRLAAGDFLFLCSDGVVEAHAAPGSGAEVVPFGYDRLAESLGRHADGRPEALRDGVLADLRRFTGGAPADDDRTILVLRLADGAGKEAL